MRGNILVRYLCAFGMSAVIIFLAHYATNVEQKTFSIDSPNSSKKMTSEIQKVADAMQIKPKVVRKLYFASAADWENHTVTVCWEAEEKASKYGIICYMKKNDDDWEKIGEKEVSAQEDRTYTHQIVYGREYEYEIRIYQLIAGKECWATTVYHDLNVRAPVLQEDEGKEKTTKYATLSFSYPRDYVPPQGIQIYRGKSKKQMELVDTVMWHELSAYSSKKKYARIKQYTDRTDSYKDYYQIRSFVDVDGKRQYGEKSEIMRFMAEGARGEVGAKVKVSRKPKINKIEVVMTNKSKFPFSMGRNYEYKKDGTEKGEKFPLFCLYCYTEIDGNANSWGIDEISYKFQAYDEYQILSKEDIVSIDPYETIYIRFARSDHKKFENQFYDFSEEGIYTRPDDMFIYLFQYMEESVYLYINDINTDTESFYAGIGWDIKSDPYSSDD